MLWAEANTAKDRIKVPHTFRRHPSRCRAKLRTALTMTLLSILLQMPYRSSRRWAAVLVEVSRENTRDEGEGS